MLQTLAPASKGLASLTPNATAATQSFNNLLNIITGQNQGSQRIPDQGTRPVTGGTQFPGFDSTIKIDLP